MMEIVTATEVALGKMSAIDIFGPMAMATACLMTVRLPNLGRAPVVPLPALHLFLATSWVVSALMFAMGGQAAQYAEVLSVVAPSIVLWRWFVRRQAIINWIRLIALRQPV